MPSNWRDFAPACRVHRRAPASRDPRTEPGRRRFGAASLSTAVDSAPFAPSKIVDTPTTGLCVAVVKWVADQTSFQGGGEQVLPEQRKSASEWCSASDGQPRAQLTECASPLL